MRVLDDVNILEYFTSKVLVCFLFVRENSAPPSWLLLLKLSSCMICTWKQTPYGEEDDDDFACSVLCCNIDDGVH